MELNSKINYFFYKQVATTLLNTNPKYWITYAFLNNCVETETTDVLKTSDVLRHIS